MEIFIIAVLVWIVCGVLAYGITLAFFQREFPDISDWSFDKNKSFAWELAVAGPFGLVLAFFNSGRAKHGLMYRKPKP